MKAIEAKVKILIFDTPGNEGRFKYLRINLSNYLQIPLLVHTSIHLTHVQSILQIQIHIYINVHAYKYTFIDKYSMLFDQTFLKF